MKHTAAQKYAGQRDLRYREMGGANPRHLTTEQVDHFNREGFIPRVTVFEADEAEANRRYIDGLLERALAEGDDSYSINGWQMTCAGVHDLCTNPLIVGVVADLLGPDVICLGAHYFCKLPHDPKEVSWHQDAAYWPLTPPRTVTAWLAIDDVDRENSALRVIPRTHLMGALTTELSPEDDANVLSEKVPDAERLGAPVDLELRAGQISLHSDLILHGSRRNDSNRRRCGVALRYLTPEVVSIEEDWYRLSIWCRGSDPNGNWANVPRPAGG